MPITANSTLRGNFREGICQCLHISTHLKFTSWTKGFPSLGQAYRDMYCDILREMSILNSILKFKIQIPLLLLVFPQNSHAKNHMDVLPRLESLGRFLYWSTTRAAQTEWRLVVHIICFLPFLQLLGCHTDQSFLFICLLVCLLADLGVPSPAATLPLVVPPLVFQLVQQALLVQL